MKEEHDPVVFHKHYDRWVDKKKDRRHRTKLDPKFQQDYKIFKSYKIPEDFIIDIPFKHFIENNTFSNYYSSHSESQNLKYYPPFKKWDPLIKDYWDFPVNILTNKKEAFSRVSFKTREKWYFLEEDYVDLGFDKD